MLSAAAFLRLHLFVLRSSMRGTNCTQGNTNTYLWLKKQGILRWALYCISSAHLAPPSLGYSVYWERARTRCDCSRRRLKHKSAVNSVKDTSVCAKCSLWGPSYKCSLITELFNSRSRWHWPLIARPTPIHARIPGGTEYLAGPDLQDSDVRSQDDARFNVSEHQPAPTQRSGLFWEFYICSSAVHLEMMSYVSKVYILSCCWSSSAVWDQCQLLSCDRR